MVVKTIIEQRCSMKTLLIQKIKYKYQEGILYHYTYTKEKFFHKWTTNIMRRVLEYSHWEWTQNRKDILCENKLYQTQICSCWYYRAVGNLYHGLLSCTKLRNFDRVKNLDALYMTDIKDLSYERSLLKGSNTDK